MRYRFPKSVQLIREKATAYLVSERVLRLTPLTQAEMDLLARFEEGDDVSAIVGAAPRPAAFRKLIDVLVRARYLVVAHDNQWKGTRLEKIFDYAEAMGADAPKALERLVTASVLVLGVGGVGCLVLQQLVAAGVQRFKLVDFDRVALHNLNRQFIYRPDQVGRLKVDAAREYVLGIEPAAEVAVSATAVASAAMLEEHLRTPNGVVDLLIHAADSPQGAIDTFVLEACMRMRVPFVSGGCRAFTAAWSAVARGQVPPGDLATAVAPGIGPKAPITALSFGPTNSVLSDFMAMDAVHLLIGLPPLAAGCEVTIDFRNLSIRPKVLVAKQSPDVRSEVSSNKCPDAVWPDVDGFR